jgi:hypothetical protein
MATALERGNEGDAPSHIRTHAIAGDSQPIRRAKEGRQRVTNTDANRQDRLQRLPLPERGAAGAEQALRMREGGYDRPTYPPIVPAIGTRKTEIPRTTERHPGRIKERRGRNGGDSHDSRNRDSKAVSREAN